MTLVFQALEDGGSDPSWLKLMLILIPSAATVAVAWLGAPWLKDRLSRNSSSTSGQNPSTSSSSEATLPPAAVAVSPADPLVIRLIEGLQSDLARARRSETKLIEQRIVGVETIARLHSELDDKEQRLNRALRELAIAQRLEESHKQELLTLRAEVTILRERLRAANL